MRCHGGDACRASDAARLLDGSFSSLPAPSPLRSLSSPPAPPLRYALIRTGTLVVCSALQGSKEASDENHNFHPRRSFPRRHSGSGYVSEVICTRAPPCERNPRSLV